MATPWTPVPLILLLLATPSRSSAAQAAATPSSSPPPTVTAVEITGLDRLDPPVEIPERLPLRRGEPYSIEGIEETDALIVSAFAERGHPYVSLQVDVEVDPDAGTASVRMEVTDEGPPVEFGTAQVMVQEPIEESVIRERIAYAAGDPYRPSRMEETRDRLIALPVVGEALVIPVGLDTGETVIHTIVSVAAVPRPREPELSGALSSRRCVQLQAFWHDRYFLNGPRFLSVGAGTENLLASQIGDRFPCSDVGEDDFADPGYFISADLRQPWPGRPLTTLAGSLFLRRESAPQAYVLRSAGGRLEVRRVFRRDMLAALAYAPERTEVRAAGFYFCATFGACSDQEIAGLQATRVMAPLSLAVQWIPGRTREAVSPRPALPGLPPPSVSRTETLARDPRWRPWVYVEVQGAGRFTASDLSWARIEGEGSLARFVGDHVEVVIRGRAGWTGRGGDLLPPQLRFFSGGPNSVRGVDQNLLGPLILVTSPDEAVELGCALDTRGCPTGTTADPDLVRPRPRGAGLVLEGNLEGRIRLTRRLQFAAFVDYGFLRSEALLPEGEVSQVAEGGATPGLGLRITTPLGLVRLDAGYDWRGGRLLPLLAPTRDEAELLFLGDVRWSPYSDDASGSLRRFLRRIQLSLSLGQPF